MHAQKMQLGEKKNKNLVHIQSWDQVEVFLALTGLIFEMLFKIMQSWGSALGAVEGGEIGAAGDVPMERRGLEITWDSKCSSDT